MEGQTIRCEVEVDSETVGNAFIYAGEHNMLCRTCAELINSRGQAGTVIAGREICGICAAVVEELLWQEFERGLQEGMREQGIPARAIRVVEVQ